MVIITGKLGPWPKEHVQFYLIWFPELKERPSNLTVKVVFPSCHIKIDYIIVCYCILDDSQEARTALWALEKKPTSEESIGKDSIWKEKKKVEKKIH